MAYPIDDGRVWSVWQIMSSTGLLFEKNFSFEITGRPTRARPDPDPPPPPFLHQNRTNIYNMGGCIVEKQRLTQQNRRYSILFPGKLADITSF